MAPRYGAATALEEGGSGRDGSPGRTPLPTRRGARSARQCRKRVLSEEVHGQPKSPISYSQPAMAAGSRADMVKPCGLLHTSARDGLLLQRRALGTAALGMLAGPARDTVKSTVGICWVREKEPGRFLQPFLRAAALRWQQAESCLVPSVFISAAASRDVVHLYLAATWDSRSHSFTPMPTFSSQV